MRYNYAVERLWHVVSIICPSVRLSVRYGCIVAKRCEIGLKLLLITDRKSHTEF